MEVNVVHALLYNFSSSDNSSLPPKPSQMSFLFFVQGNQVLCQMNLNCKSFVMWMI